MKRENAEKIACLIEHPEDGNCRQQVADLLSADAGVLEELVEQWQLHSELQWSLLPAPAAPAEQSAHDVGLASLAPHRRLGRIGSYFCIAAAVCVVIAAGIAYTSRLAPAGTVVATENISWAAGSRPVAVGESFRRGPMEVTSGSCTLQFNSGAKLVCEGAFRLRVIDDMHVELAFGKLRANVPPAARGFSVDTPDTLLVDQGTEFGVSTESGEGTRIVVFRGVVDVHTKGATDGPNVRRLTQGEAALVQSGRKNFDRLTQVTSGSAPSNWAPGDTEGALFSIRDNIRGADSLKYYNVVVGGLNEDVPAWVDRVHEWNGLTTKGIPEIVRDADYAMTFNDDRYNPSFRMYVTVHRPAVLYIFIDDRANPLPDWLTKDFVDTGEDIGLDEGLYQNYYKKLARGPGQGINQKFSIWKRVISQPTELELGGITAPPQFGMYGLAAKAL